MKMSIAKRIRERRDIEIAGLDYDENNKETLEEYYDRIINVDTTEYVKEYGDYLDSFEKEFLHKSGLDEIDLVFMGLATALQLIRINIIDKMFAGQINELTNRANASESKIEKNLHEMQDKLFKSHAKQGNQIATQYYAPINQIIDSHNVPYDASRYKHSNLKLFKGGNHRISAVGHDPLLGLLLGTGNILTNTITCNSGNESMLHLPSVRTYHVEYTQNFTNSILGKTKAYSNPMISDEASTGIMLYNMFDRVLKEPEAVVLALVKQILHIGTDIFTTYGLPLPALSLLTSSEYASKITKYVDSGDVIKHGVLVGESAMVSIGINRIISILHKITCTGETELDNKVIDVRTRKIIMYSNSIATSSNIIHTAVTKDINTLDIGGLLVTANRIAKDTQYMKEIRREYVRSKTSEIYTNEYNEILVNNYLV